MALPMPVQYSGAFTPMMSLDVMLLCENAAVMLSTHLIYDVERIFDDIVVMDYGRMVAADSADHLREASGMSLDQYFREVFRC